MGVSELAAVNIAPTASPTRVPTESTPIAAVEHKKGSSMVAIVASVSSVGACILILIAILWYRYRTASNNNKKTENIMGALPVSVGSPIEGPSPLAKIRITPIRDAAILGENPIVPVMEPKISLLSYLGIARKPKRVPIKILPIQNIQQANIPAENLLDMSILRFVLS